MGFSHNLGFLDGFIFSIFLSFKMFPFSCDDWSVIRDGTVSFHLLCWMERFYPKMLHWTFRINEFASVLATVNLWDSSTIYASLFVFYSSSFFPYWSSTRGALISVTKIISFKSWNQECYLRWCDLEGRSHIIVRLQINLFDSYFLEEGWCYEIYSKCYPLFVAYFVKERKHLGLSI